MIQAVSRPSQSILFLPSSATQPGPSVENRYFMIRGGDSFGGIGASCVFENPAYHISSRLEAGGRNGQDEKLELPGLAAGLAEPSGG